MDGSSSIHNHLANCDKLWHAPRTLLGEPDSYIVEGARTVTMSYSTLMCKHMLQPMRTAISYTEKTGKGRKLEIKTLQQYII